MSYTRAEKDLVLSFGDVFHDTEGRAWVFTGWRRNTAGKMPTFARENLG